MILGGYLKPFPFNDTDNRTYRMITNKNVWFYSE